MTKIIHVANSIVPGGVEQGMLTLLREGFYQGTDLHIVELWQGEGFMRDEMTKLVGESRMAHLALAKTPPLQRPPRIIRYFNHAAEMITLALKLRKVIRGVKPDTIIISCAFPHTIGRAAAFLNRNIKVVSFEHGTNPSTTPERLLLKLTSLRNDLILGDTAESLRRRVPPHYARTNPTHVVSLAMFDAMEVEPVRTPDVFKIVAGGRLSHEKNYLELVHAAAILAEKNYPFKLTIAGDGPERENLESAIKHYEQTRPELRMGERVVLAGWLKGEALQTLRNTADVFAHVGLYEGFGLAPAEAMAAGRPCVFTNFGGGLNEYGNDQNRVLVKGNKREGIAESLQQLMDHYAELAPGLQKNAYDTMQALYGRDAVKQQWRDVMDILKAPRQPRQPLYRALTSTIYEKVASAFHRNR